MSSTKAGEAAVPAAEFAAAAAAADASAARAAVGVAITVLMEVPAVQQ